MYVRLAFAVAAHLESEILIVDEVLAVGDAEFQKKCIGRMKNISSNHGRTVLFVSHNMGAIKNLCNSGILLKNGSLFFGGGINDVIEKYLISEVNETSNVRDKKEIDERFGFLQWELINGETNDSVFSRENLILEFTFFSKIKIDNAELGLVIRDYKGDIIFSCNNRDNGGDYLQINQGIYKFQFEFRFPVREGGYELDIVIVSKNEILDQWISSKKISVLSKYESVLPDNWLGLLNEIPSFKMIRQ